MTIRQLEYFMEVAQQLSYSKAAENLFVSQSALSRSIAALEEELGTVLFFRNRHSVALTPAGITLATAMPKLSADLDRIVGLVRQTKEGMRGRLNIGVQNGMGLPEVLSSALEYFRKSLPFIPVSPQCMEREALMEALDDGKLDFAISYDSDSPTTGNEGKSWLLLERAPMCAAAGEGSGFGQQARLHELAEESFIFTGPGTSSAVVRWEDFCRSRGIMPKIQLVPSYETRAFMIEQGYGVGVFPESHRIFARSDIKKISMSETYNAYSFIMWSTMNLNPSVDIFVKVIKGDI